MSERAQVRSVESLAAFRSQLIVFVTKARALLEEATEEKQRVRVWLESDRRPFWEAECRRRASHLQTAEQELFSAKLSRVQTATAGQFLAVERARRALREAEAKRDMVKRWTREFENRAEPLAKQIEQLQSFLTTDLVRAASGLGHVIGTLEAYTRVQPDAAMNPGSTSIPPATTAPPESASGSPESASDRAEPASQ